jgi:hypothetical protein
MGIEEFLGGVFGAIPPHKHPEQDSNNPSDFPRATEIADSDCLMAISSLEANTKRQQVLFEQLRELTDELNIVRAERQIIDTKLYRRLRELYPEVSKPVSCGMGWRRWDGKTYYVGWGGHLAEEQSKGGEPSGGEETG